ncbi:phage tail protein [Escherichia coli]|uniref:phage tail protein n=1 Tax=Escherichia coli TaxID=562 RepID=UPI0010AD3E8C|nr:phage tail protein [Escherichia coli]EHD7191594.1 phage tail protein [Escherichia coli]EHL6538960.1 phage tail protein [Escherichia coli]TJE92237.1 phage tail protein [Escherichia coli]
MLKLNTLREALTSNSRWCKANPEKFTVFIESGGIETTAERPSFLYRYNLVVFIMDFTESIDNIMLPVMAWLYRNQPDLLLNPEKNKNIKFSAAINDDDSADILLEIPVWERVIVRRNDDGTVTAEHIGEPPISRALEAWRVVFEDMTWKTAEEAGA